MKSFSKGAYAPVVLLMVSSLGAPTAFAGFPQGNNVTMGGEPVFAIRSTVDGYTPEHRAQLAQDALDNALATADCAPALVTVERVNGAPVVEYNGHLVATADQASADAAGMPSAYDLAEDWANSIRRFLSDGVRARYYKNSLIGHNPIQASITYVERRMYVPEGTRLPVTLGSALATSSLKAGDYVSAKVREDVPIGQFIVPEGSLVLGKVVETRPSQLTIVFTDLQTPSGSETPINASLAAPGTTGSSMPHPVCTISMPAGIKTAARVPAMVAIGAKNEDSFERLAFAPGENVVIEAGQPMTIILDEASKVALIEQNTSM